MLNHLILTILCDDKPGIVNDLAATIAKHQGNWLESHLAQLGGKFAGVVRVAVAEADHKALSQALKDLVKRDIQVIIDIANVNSAHKNSSKASFTATGPDRQGIVQEISLAFAERGINVEELETQCSSMPYSGDPLFEAQGKLLITDDTDLDSLTDELELIAEKLAIDVSLKEC